MRSDAMVLWRKAKAYASIWPQCNYQDQEDFASWFIIQKLKGASGSFAQLYIDWLRQTKGDSRKISYEDRIQLKYCEPQNIERIAVTIPKMETDLDIFENIKNRDDRMIAILKYKWGLQNDEIAHCFGVGPSRISQRFRCLQAGIRAYLRKDEEGFKAKYRTVRWVKQKNKKALRYRCVIKDLQRSIHEIKSQRYGLSRLIKTGRRCLAESA